MCTVFFHRWAKVEFKTSRSLVTTLRAAEKFEQSHLSSPAVAKAIDEAKFHYVEGFFLTHGFASVLELAKKVSGASKASKGHIEPISEH